MLVGISSLFALNISLSMRSVEEAVGHHPPPSNAPTLCRPLYNLHVIGGSKWASTLLFIVVVVVVGVLPLLNKPIKTSGWRASLSHPSVGERVTKTNF